MVDSLLRIPEKEEKKEIKKPVITEEVKPKAPTNTGGNRKKKKNTK